MNGGKQPQGYTIVEVMIFLAISGALFASASGLLSGQQRKTEFAQAIREIESQLQDTINDVATGYYTNTNNFTCAAGPSITSGINEQGANKECIFLGRAIQFGVQGTDPEGFNIYTVVGNRQASGKEVKDYDEAKPTAIAPGATTSPGVPSAIDNKALQSGLKVAKMSIGGGPPIGAVGFFSSLAAYDATGNNLLSGAQTVDLIAMKDSSLGQTSPASVDEINRRARYGVNPAGGVIICFKSAGTEQFGIITIGSGSRQLTTKLEIVATATAPAVCT